MKSEQVLPSTFQSVLSIVTGATMDKEKKSIIIFHSTGYVMNRIWAVYVTVHDVNTPSRDLLKANDAKY
jgi:hypothetical protein